MQDFINYVDDFGKEFHNNIKEFNDKNNLEGYKIECSHDYHMKDYKKCNYECYIIFNKIIFTTSEMEIIKISFEKSILHTKYGFEFGDLNRFYNMYLYFNTKKRKNIWLLLDYISSIKKLKYKDISS